MCASELPQGGITATSSAGFCTEKERGEGKGGGGEGGGEGKGEGGEGREGRGRGGEGGGEVISILTQLHTVMCGLVCGVVGATTPQEVVENLLCFRSCLHILKPHNVGDKGEVPQQEPVRDTVPDQPGKQRCEHKL